MSDSFEIAVVGGGAAGDMAILRAVLYNRRTVLFTGDLDSRRRSRAQWVSEVDNMPGLFGRPHPITGSLQATRQWIEAQDPLKSRLTVIKASVHTLTRLEAGFELSWTEKHRRNPTGITHTASARYVVLATGIMDIQPHIGGAIDPIFSFANANQVLYCLQCDGHRAMDHPTAVIGHTTEAAWVAIQLHERYAPPSLVLLTHDQPFTGSEEVRELLDLYDIRVREGAIGEIAGKARAEGLQGFVVGGELIPAERAFVALGTMVYHDLAVQLGARIDARGYVTTNAAGETTVPGLYAVGDLQAGKKKQIYTAWDSAVDAVEDIDRKLRRERRHALLQARRGAR